jgi:hypothetical protein
MKTGNEDHYITTMVEDWENEDCHVTVVKTIYKICYLSKFVCAVFTSDLPWRPEMKNAI